jgi:hypothetical protein
MTLINGKRLAEKQKGKECIAKQRVNECTWWLGRFYLYILILYLTLQCTVVFICSIWFKGLGMSPREIFSVV